MRLFFYKLWLRWHYRNWPAVTDEMRSQQLTWCKRGNEFFECCEVCGGNCGQCGMTGRVGNVGFSMQRLADNLEGRTR